MDTLIAESGPLHPVLETRAVRPNLVAIYCNDTVVEALLPYRQPVFVPRYCNGDDTIYMIEGHGRRLIPSVDKVLRAQGKDDEDEDDHVVVPPPPRAQPVLAQAKPVENSLPPATSQDSTVDAWVTHPAIKGPVRRPPPSDTAAARPQGNKRHRGEIDFSPWTSVISGYREANEQNVFTNAPTTRQLSQAQRQMFDAGATLAEIGKRFRPDMQKQANIRWVSLYKNLNLTAEEWDRLEPVGIGVKKAWDITNLSGDVREGTIERFIAKRLRRAKFR